MKKTIYNLDLHETFYIEEKNCFVTRVASGWIYEFYKNKYNTKLEYYEDVFNNVVFVPFDNRFQSEKQ